jgi:hypothetical protein
MYANLKEIYRKTQGAMWSMSVAYLLDKGFTYVQQITDEQIETLNGNTLMTADFEQDIVRTARDIANECGNDVIEIIQFCMIEECFDTEWYKEE